MNLTTDNASVNTVMVEAIAGCLKTLYNISFHPDNHVRCINHVLNLTVQAILAELDEAEKCDDDEHDDNCDSYLLNKDAPVYLDAESDDEQQALEENRQRDLDETEDEIIVEKLEKDEASQMSTGSPVKRVRCSCFQSHLMTHSHIAPSASFLDHQNCFITPAPAKILEDFR